MAATNASIRLKVTAEGVKPADHKKLMARMLELALQPQSGKSLPAGDPPTTPCDHDPDCIFLEEGTDPDGARWRMYQCHGEIVVYYF